MKSVVIVAAGLSNRYGGKNKLNEDVLGKTVLERSVNVFRGVADEIIVVGNYKIDGVKTVEGGVMRYRSVLNGLSAVSLNCKTVAIHDGARPFVSKALVSKLFGEAMRYGSAVPYVSAVDTVWQRDESGAVNKLNREDVLAVQTPQVFDYARLMSAIANASESDFTDESSVYFSQYKQVRFVEGERSNVKITFFGDVPDYRVGTGFDVHAFGEGSGVILGGAVVPYDKKLIGHSDADVLCHAVCDAVLSASGNRDIGCQFPDTDDKYLNADSIKLLEQCVRIANSSGFIVENVSAVIICQQPKLADYLGKMAVNLAEVLQVSADCVNLSATTTERLGALGNGDGIACQAQALLRKII